MGCESFGVFKHEHDGICFKKRTTDSPGNYISYQCWENYSQIDCGKSFYNHWVADMTCEEFCDNAVKEEMSWGTNSHAYMPECGNLD